jgi:hypothetical protein
MRARFCFALGLATLCLGAITSGSMAPAGAAVPADVGEPAEPMPPIIPCPACTFEVASDEFTGTLDTSYTEHRYPFTYMRLQLLDGSNNVLDTISLAPATAYGGQDMAQTVSTSATGVARAKFLFHTDDGYDLQQAVIVQ